MTRNLLALLMCLPIHAVCALLCLQDARCFDLILLWGRTRLPGMLGNTRYWHAVTYSPLALWRSGNVVEPCPRIWTQPGQCP